jgi:kynureninase
MRYQPGLEFAQRQDRDDPLAHFREQFHIPKQGNGEDEFYFCGHSLGLQPKRTESYVREELKKWQQLAVRGHFESRYPWVPYHKLLAEKTAALVGAKLWEVVTMNSLTVNLHLMMVSFYRPTAERHKILIENHAFPSDHYAVESQIRFHGFDPTKSLLLVTPRPGEERLRIADLAELIEREGLTIALILFPGAQYYTGQILDMAEITRLGHAQGCMVGFDLAHATGNIPLKLHEWGCDFACWCTYKYLNSGPGSVAGCFVHERYAEIAELPRFAGWWGHEQATRFQMSSHFKPMLGAEGWQLSNPPILSLCAIRASLDIFGEAGGMLPLRKKSERLTGYLEFLLQMELKDHIEIITPRDPAERGCQLSLKIKTERMTGQALFAKITEAGITCDWREPDVIRVAPVPLYNRFEDVYRFVEILKANL